MLKFISTTTTLDTVASNSNTSHVKVYLSMVERIEDVWIYSNTSHVKVYPKHQSTNISHQGIQIHLMLKFILNVAVNQCCFNFIQIHLMLKFIILMPSVLPIIHHSNTSHVKVYLCDM